MHVFVSLRWESPNYTWWGLACSRPFAYCLGKQKIFSQYNPIPSFMWTIRRMIFRSLWRKNSRPQHPLVKSIILYVLCGLSSETFIFFSITTHKTIFSQKYKHVLYMHVAHILWLTCLCCNFTCAIHVFISSLEKHRCQGMSEHLKDPKYTLVPRGLRHRSTVQLVVWEKTLDLTKSCFSNNFGFLKCANRTLGHERTIQNTLRSPDLSDEQN